MTYAIHANPQPATPLPSANPLDEARRPAHYFPALDGLRTIAVALVFLVHFYPEKYPLGWAGVQVFFVLSGFLITGILYDSRDQPHRLKNFYLRRTLRIFPLYYAFFFACCLVLLITHGLRPHFFWLWAVYAENFWWIATHNVGTDILFTGGHRAFAAIGHLWSLAIEEQFYLVWPFVVFAISGRRRLMNICLALIILRIALALFFQVHLSPGLLHGGITYRMLPTQADGFLMGGFLALYQRGSRERLSLPSAGALAASALAICAALFAALEHWPALTRSTFSLSYISPFQAVIGLPLLNLVSLALLWAAITPGSWVYSLCALAPMRSLGRVSYGLYVFHLPVFVVCSGAVGRTWLHLHLNDGARLTAALLTTCVTIAISYASYYFYEVRFLKLKNRFTYKSHT